MSLAFAVIRPKQSEVTANLAKAFGVSYGEAVRAESFLRHAGYMLFRTDEISRLAQAVEKLPPRRK